MTQPSPNDMLRQLYLLRGYPRILVERKLGEQANQTLYPLQDEMRKGKWPADLRAAMWRKVAQRAATFAAMTEAADVGKPDSQITTDTEERDENSFDGRELFERGGRKPS
jgi:hypothetical protein